jgi:hypothetical protein
MEISAPTGIPPPPDTLALPGQIPSTPVVVRAVSVRNKNAPPIKASQISSPVELLSTTNMLSYNAPDIKTYRKEHAKLQTQIPVSPLDPAGSRSSSDESDSRSSNSSHRSNGTLTDASSVETSPISSPQPHDFQSYFAKSATQAPMRRSKSTAASHRKSLSIDDPTPEVPHRAPSHSMRAHQRLARQKSVGHISQSSQSSSTHSPQRSQSGSLSGRLSREERSSMDFFKTTVDPKHPFNKELEQVNELAEELTTTVRDVEMDEDQMKMLERGLSSFSAADYCLEIQPLFYRCYPELLAPIETPTWI